MRSLIYNSFVALSLVGYALCPSGAAGAVIDTTNNGNKPGTEKSAKDTTLMKGRIGAGETGGDDETAGTIRGKVTTADGQPAASVTVRLKGINKTTLSEDDGTFTFRNLKAGNYEVEISLTGYTTITKIVTVDARRATAIDIQLQVSEKQLQEVVVVGGQNKYGRKSSNYVSKMPLQNMENPQVYTTIGKEIIADQMVYSVDEAMRNATGVQKMWDATGRSGDGGSYYNSRGFIMQSQLRNGIAGNVSGRIDAANLERIEVIKGPSATLFGSSLTSYGGLINRVTKKPFANFGGEVSYAGGNYGFNRVSADINTPLDDEKSVLMRVNMAYLDQGSWQDNGFNRSFVFAPSISYKASDRLSFLFDAEIYTGRNLGTPIFFFPYGQTIASMGVNRADKMPIDYKRSFFSDDLSQRSTNANFFGQMNYKLNGKWSTQTNVTVTNSYSDGPSPYFYMLANSAVTGNSADIGSDYISRNDQFTQNSRDRMIEIQQTINGDFNIGRFRNRFVGGLDYFNHNSNQLFGGQTYDTIMSHGTIPTYRSFNKGSLDSLYSAKGVAFWYPVQYVANTYSAFAADVFNILDNLSVMAALRIDHLVNNGNYSVITGTTSGGYNQTALSPKFGIVYQPIADKVSLFANYQNGFTNQQGTDKEGKSFKPQHANQAEAGVKVDLLGGRLTSTVSYYHINVDNVLRTDPSAPLYSMQDGTQVSEGVEAEVVASPLKGLSIMAGFSYNNSKYTKADADVQGRRPGTASAPYTANWWISYKLPDHVVKGLGVGFGGNYASDNDVINSVSQGIFTLPAYTVLNASVFYDCNKFRFSLKSDNLTNQKYWIGYSSMNPQQLRTVIGSVSFRF